MRRLVSYLMAAASLVFIFIVLQNHFGLTERIQRWRSNFSAPDLRNKNYQVNFDVAGQKGTISIKTQPSEAPEKNSLKKPQRVVAAPHKKTEPPPPAPSGTKSQ
jgi:hypothetical protein